MHRGIREEKIMPLPIKNQAVRLMLCAVFLCTAGAGSATELIQDLAGGGSVEGYAPGQATLDLGTQAGLAVGPGGDIYVSDTNHNQVIKLDSVTGQIRLVAGNGAAAFFGDGLPAPSASLNRPGALAFDASSNLLIVD